MSTWRGGERLMATYARADIVFERGEGARLHDAEGREYVDFIAGIGVNALGHAHPALVAALGDQARKLWHVSNLFRVHQAEELASALCEISFAEVVFFANSGAEAVEAAIKTARRHFWARGEKRRWRVITFEGAFHGRTLATIAAGGKPQYLEGFGEPCAGFDQAPFGDLAAVERAIGEETAAILIEPVQGEGGVRVASAEFLRGLRRLCDDHGLLLIFDEVQCGMGRTGAMFACEHAGVWPDVMALAKGLGGGFPVGACLATRDAAAGMTAGSHGSTFGGNPLAMAVAGAVVAEMRREGFFEHVREMGERLAEALARLTREFEDVFEPGVRGLGLMRGLKCRMENAQVVAEARRQGVLVAGAGENVVRFLPPLTITAGELSDGLERFREACCRLAACKC